MNKLGSADFASAAWPLIAVIGPTGSGKSELALFLAERLNGEILNCDSVQVYRGLEIGSAKVPVCERRGIAHHLIDIIDPDQELTAGAYARMAREVLREVRGRKRVPIVAGGTGFYLRALLEGLSPAPGRDEDLRARLTEAAQRRPATLHRFLRRYDAAAAARIHANDRQKLIRAIEMMFLARRPLSDVQAAPRDRLEGFAVMKIGPMPERQLLYERLDRRAEAMFGKGLIHETRQLFEAGFAAEAKPLQSLGYKQAAGVLRGELTEDEAVRECQTRTRQYAKRQMTWFRAEREVEWLEGFGCDSRVQERALERAQAFVAGHVLTS